MRPILQIELLEKLLAPKKRTTIVDVGANPINGKPPYAVFRRSGLCEIIGFEPQKEALDALQDAIRENETYLPYAVGDGSTETLYITKNSGLVSIFPIADWTGDLLNPWWKQAARVKEKIEMQTQRLDDIKEIERIDFLKIDIQGGELKVFENGRKKLANAAMIQTEVSFLPYYEGAPSFGDIQSELADQGFIVHMLTGVSRHHLGYPLRYAKGKDVGPSQITVADVIFLRDPRKLDDLDTEVLKHMAILAHSVLRSIDLVLMCFGELERRDVIDGEQIQTYLNLLPDRKK